MMPALPRPFLLGLAAAGAIGSGAWRPQPLPPLAPRPVSAGPGESLDPRVPLTARGQRWVDSTLATLTPRQRAAQLIHVWLVGDYESTADSAFAVTARWVRDDGIGGILMSVGSPVEVAVKLNALQAMARVPLLVGADVEPSIGRLEGGLFIPSMIRGGSATIIPTAMAIGATGDTLLAYEAGRVVGREARAVGVHLAYAPVADVNVNPANPVINVRSFGEDPAAVTAMTGAFTRGIQAAGAFATVKHFPGHGDTDTDSHNALPVVRLTRARLDSVELPPFRAAIDAGAAAVMSAHIANPTWLGSMLPATLQRRVMTDFLRDSLRFRGLAITDALTMDGVARLYSQPEIAVRAVESGADVLLKPSDVAPVLDALEARAARDAGFRARLDEAARRNLEMKVRIGLDAGAQVSLDSLRAIVGSAVDRAMARTIAARAITLLRDGDSAVPLARSRAYTVVVYTPETEFGGGNAFIDELRKHRTVRVVRAGPLTPRATLDAAVRESARGSVIVLTVVRRIEGRGRVAIADGFAAWMNAIAPRLAPTVVAAGNPYVIGQFPGVTRYLATFSVGVEPERAAARALVGAQPITGRAPISLPGQFARGDGLSRGTAP